MSISRIAVVAVTLLVTIIVFSGVQVFAENPAPPSNSPNPTSAQHQVKKQHHGTTEHKAGGPGNAKKAAKGSTELK